MKKLIILSVATIISAVTFAEGVPQVSIVDWTDSLDIVDDQNNPVTLDHARIIDKNVNGSVPAHDSTYNNYRMELIAHFDRQIKANGVTMYGLIYADGYDIIWGIIEGITGEKTRKVWKPIKIPALQVNQEITLIRTMLGSDFNVYYDKTKLTPTYGLSFVEWIQKFYCGIQYHSTDYLGTICTIDVVLIHPDTNERIKLNSFEYRYDKGKYKEDDPGQWFNCRVGWYNEIPKDFNKCVNCSVSELEDESLNMKQFGEMEVDGKASVTVNTNKFSGRSVYKKKITAIIKGGKDICYRTFSQSITDSGAEPDGTFERTMACSFYAEDGVTNLMGLVQIGNSNKYVKLNCLQQPDLSGDIEFTMILYKNRENTFVSYYVNGIPYNYDGYTVIPIIEYPERNQIHVAGSAVVTDIYGDLIKIPMGFNMIIEDVK